MIKNYFAVLPFWPVMIHKDEDYFLLPALTAKNVGYESSLLVYSPNLPNKEKEKKIFQGVNLFFCKTIWNLYKNIPEKSVIHIQTAYRSSLLLLFLLTLKRKKCRIIWTPHTSFGKKHPFGFCFNIFRTLPFVFRRIDRIIAITKFEKRYLEKLGYKNVAYLPLIINAKRFSKTKRRKNTKEFVFLFVGGERKVKGLATVLKAFSVFKEFGINSRLFVLGGVGDDFKEKYCYLINDKVDFLGFVKPLSNRLINLFQKSNCYINASFQEGSPLAAMEAAAAGLSLCLSDLRTLKSIFSDNAVYFKVGDWPGLVESMFFCFYNEGIMNEKVLKNKKLVQDFSYEEFKDKFTGLLKITS